MKNPNTRSNTEEWLARMGTKFCDVWLFVKGCWIDERHVADNETFLATVVMSIERLGATYALWSDATEWCLIDRNGSIRRYPNREAAEMVAIHNG